MTIDRSNNNYIRLIPSEGKALFNGEVTSEDVYTPIDADLSVWSEIEKTLKDETING